MRKTSKIISLLTLVIVLSVCADRQEAPSDSGIASESPSLSVLLDELTPEGWAIYDQVFQFKADNLYERINGRAELYLSYDVIGLTTATYEDEADIGRFVELSIYDMANPTNAFGIFSVERFQGEPPLDLGRMSYRSGSNAYIWKGRYYVTVVVSDSTEDLQKIGLDFANKVTAALNETDEQVWGLSALPQDNLIPDSIQYFKVDAMGLDFMQNTYTAEYMEGETIFKTFLSRQANSDDARDMVERYAQYSREYGRGYERAIKDGAEFVLCDMGGAFDVISQKGRVVSGVISIDNPDKALELAAGLRRLILSSI